MQNSDMNRRELMTAGLAASSLAAVTALNKGADFVEHGRDGVEARLKVLEKKFDKLEHHHKNLIRVGGIAFAVSTGVDVVSFL
jgi:hypothetical protein